MRVFLIGLLAVQVATFAVLGSVMLARGEYRLGVAQILLAVVQAVIYSGGVS